MVPRHSQIGLFLSWSMESTSIFLVSVAIQVVCNYKVFNSISSLKCVIEKEINFENRKCM